MPTNFRLDLQEPLRSTIKGQTLAVGSKRKSGEWCSYAQFVENLGKPMPRAADEAHHHTTGMAGEAGELLDITKKSWIYEKPIDVEHILEEMGDLRWYYQSMLNMLGLVDEDIQAHNTVKLMKRYPNGVYSNADAIARADKAASSERKFMGQPKVVSSSEMKPLPPGFEENKGIDMRAARDRVEAAMQRVTKQIDVEKGVEDPGKPPAPPMEVESPLHGRTYQEHSAVMAAIGSPNEGDGSEHLEIMREITGHG